MTNKEIRMNTFNTGIYNKDIIDALWALTNDVFLAPTVWKRIYHP